MNGDEFLDKMELINPEYVLAAEQENILRRSNWSKLVKIAVCFALVIFGSMATIWYDMSKTVNKSNLHAVTIPDLKPAGMGFEGYILQDISELNNGNPWSESLNIKQLPVYKNKAFDSTLLGIPKGLKEADMKRLLFSTSSSLGLKVDSVDKVFEQNSEKNGISFTQNPVEIYAITNRGKISVGADGIITYFLPDGGRKLPASYNFSLEKAFSYFLNSYRDLLDFDNPRLIISGDYDIYGKFKREYIVYNHSEDKVKNILNYNFRSAEFLLNDNGRLSIIRINDNLLVAEKLADYPIITVEEATKRLTGGHYQSSVPIEFSKEEAIAKVELIYRSGAMEEVLLPYYRFYVLLPDESNSLSTDKKFKTYGAYYVPALKEEHIVNMPVYKGAFN